MKSGQIVVLFNRNLIRIQFTLPIKRIHGIIFCFVLLYQAIIISYESILISNILFVLKVIYEHAVNKSN